MNKQRRQPGPPVKSQRSKPDTRMLLTAVIFLGLGLAAGYFLGRHAGTSTPADAPAAAAGGQLVNPSAFIEMEASLLSSVRKNPRDLDTLIRIGNLYYDNSKFREAVDWYGRALEIDPNNVSVRTDRGTSYWNIGQPDAAIAEFSLSLQSNPTHPQTLYNLGVVYLHGKGAPAEARKAWEKLLETNPGYPEREKLRQQIAELSASTPPDSTGGVEDLLQRMKTR